MKVLESPIMQGFMRMAQDGFDQGWHERNGGNLTYRMKREEVEQVWSVFLPMSLKSRTKNFDYLL